MADQWQLLRECEIDIREGRANRAQEKLKSVGMAAVPKAARLPLANLCRRAGLFSQGLKALVRTIRSEDARPTAAELAEYAVLLQRSGAPEEALQILEGLDPRSVPEALLYRAFCLFNLWDYESAVAPLRLYLDFPLSEYSALVGRVNLAAALVMTGHLDGAELLIRQNLETASAQNATRLRANCLELLAQVQVHRGELAGARRVATEARILLGEVGTLESLFARKWEAVATALATGDTRHMDGIRSLALRLGDWETVREADFFALKVRYDPSVFRHLYYGTPFLPYRRRLIRAFGDHDLSGQKFLIGAGGSAPTLDLATGETTFGTGTINAGKKIHLCLHALLRDAYRPANICSLFSRLYPDEYYNPFTSPTRVQQLLRRTRRWLECHRVPARIDHEQGRYRLRITGPFSFLMDGENDGPGESWSHLWATAVRRLNPDVLFTSAHAVRTLGISPSKFKRFALWAIETGRLRRLGAGRGTVYGLLAHNRINTAA